jgi:hypothetical protein
LGFRRRPSSTCSTAAAAASGPPPFLPRRFGAPRERICGWKHLVQGAEACRSGACPLAGARAQLQRRWQCQLRVQNIVFVTQYCLLKTIINNNQKQYYIYQNNIYSLENNNKQYLKNNIVPSNNINNTLKQYCILKQ